MYGRCRSGAVFPAHGVDNRRTAAEASKRVVIHIAKARASHWFNNDRWGRRGGSGRSRTLPLLNYHWDKRETRIRVRCSATERLGHGGVAAYFADGRS